MAPNRLVNMAAREINFEKNPFLMTERSTSELVSIKAVLERDQFRWCHWQIKKAMLAQNKS